MSKISTNNSQFGYRANLGICWTEQGRNIYIVWFVENKIYPLFRDRFVFVIKSIWNYRNSKWISLCVWSKFIAFIIYKWWSIHVNISCEILVDQTNIHILKWCFIPFNGIELEIMSRIYFGNYRSNWHNVKLYQACVHTKASNY